MRQVILESRVPERRLGRHINHDPRSRNFRFEQTVPRMLRSAQHTRVIPVLDQGNIGACTGFAAEGCLGTEPYYSSIKDAIKPSKNSDIAREHALGLYSLATRLDEFPGSWPPDDTGSDGTSVAKACVMSGAVSGYLWAFTLEDALQALSDRPVIVGMNWYSSFDFPDSSGEIKINKDSWVRGGHEVVFDSINVELQTVGFTNSWGTGWGNSGRGWMTWETFERLMHENGDVTVFIENVSDEPPTPPPTPEPDREGCLPKMLRGLLVKRYGPPTR